MGQLYSAIFFLGALVALSLSITPVYGQTNYEFTTINQDQIKTSSVAKDMLAKIEESKRILKELQAGNQITKTPEQIAIDEQRELAKQSLQAQLDRMNKDYEPYTPKNAFATFLTGVNGTQHGLYWDQFNYAQTKIQLAKTAQKDILSNGGTFQEAMAQYIRIASMTRAELIQVNMELNIKHGFADEKIQATFDEYGKLPRYD
jgi:hypothetical protein